jgi:nitrate/TMAO reductase-like tetraheme cytochrome c subunit
MKGRIRLFIVLFSGILFTTAVMLSQCSEDTSRKPDIRGDAYANETTCASCHKNINDSYVHTAHFNTSSPITGNSLQAESLASAHTFIYNDILKVAVEKRPHGLYQVAYLNNKEARAERFDIAFGANIKAQTYGYWKGNTINELPLSYFKIINNWANSPGFPLNGAYYDRPIVTRCFECHGSFVEKKFVQTGATSVGEEFNKNAMIYGIDCQRCHGPAAQHVQFHLDNPATKAAKYITTYKSLNKQLKVSMCAVCHNGNDVQTQKSTFGYKPGDDLASFYDPFGRSNTPDVHGNQTSLLTMSKCYINSANLTCTTCHDVHQQEKYDPVISSQKCLDCHKTETHNFCKIAPQLGSTITGKCIDCHMPAMPSKLISFKMSAQNQKSPYLLHTHQIAVYPEQTQQILSLLKTVKKSD